MDIIKSKITPDTVQEKMQNFNQKMLLTASNKVLLTYGDLMQHFYQNTNPNSKNTMRLLGEIILAMREDLGHGDWKNNVYWFDAIRPWIKDIKDSLPKKYSGLRRHYNNQLNPIKKDKNK